MPGSAKNSSLLVFSQELFLLYYAFLISTFERKHKYIVGMLFEHVSFLKEYLLTLYSIRIRTRLDWRLPLVCMCCCGFHTLFIERQAAKSFVTAAEVGLQGILFSFGFGLK